MRTVRNITVDPSHQHTQSLPEKNGNSLCKPVPTSKSNFHQPLAAKKPAAVQDKYFSIDPLKPII
jgi:hypothetical protein